MRCYAFPITLISDHMNGAMVMCGARKSGCPDSFIHNIGIIRILNETDQVPCPPAITDSSTTEPADIMTTKLQSVPVSNPIQQNVTFKCTDTFNTIIGVSSLVVGFITGLLSCLLICVARMYCCRSCKNRHHQN